MNMYWKKLVSGILAILMTLSLCPISALADASEPDWSSAASAEAAGAGETAVYERDGAKSDPIGTAQMEKAIKFVLRAEKSEEHVQEEVVVAEDGTETTVQHTHVEYPYHDWRAAVVVSFDRRVAQNTVGLSTRCDNCAEGGVTGWHGFLIGRDIAANGEIILKGSFGSSLTYGKLCSKVKQILCGAFNLSDENIGTTMTVTLRLYEQNNGAETGSYITLASYKYTFAKTIQIQYAHAAEETNEEPAEGSAAPGSADPDDLSSAGPEGGDEQTPVDTEGNDEQTPAGPEGNNGQTPADTEGSDEQTPADTEGNDEQTPVGTESPDDPAKAENGEDSSETLQDDPEDSDTNEEEEKKRGGDTEEEPTDEESAAQWIVTLTSRTAASSASVSRLSGGGTYNDGDSATVTAYPRRGYHFVGWYKQDDSSFETKLSDQQSYTFTVTEDTSLVALFEATQGILFKLTVHGSLYVVNNGAVQSDMYQVSYNAGEMMYLSYRDDTKEFLYWVNASGNILSTQKDFSFALASDTEIFSYYAASDTTDGQAMVIFRNAFKQVIQSRTYSVGQPISFPKSKPNRMGYTFKGWYIADENGDPTGTEATEQAIYDAMEGANAVIVVPDYVPNGEEYTVNVKYTDAEGNELKEGVSAVMGVGDSKTFTAPSIQGYSFQYWALNGKKASYSRSYTVIFAVPGEASLQAIYSSGDANQQPEIIITQTYSKYDETNAKPYIVANTLQYFAPKEYLVMEVGFVWSKNAGLYGVAGGADKLKLDATDTKKHLSGFTSNEGIYTFNLKTSNPNNIYFEKAYMILKAPDGSIQTFYSDMTAGGFNNLQNNELTIVVVNSSSSVLNATAEVPNTTSIEDEVIVNNVATLTIFIEDAESGVSFNEESEAAKGYNVRIEGVKEDNAELLIVHMKKALPSKMQAETIQAYHEGTAMTFAASEAELTVEDTFFYDAATGDISIAVTHFSNYTFVYPVYRVEFKNEDGTVLLQYDTYAYGAVPEYDGNTPIKEADAGNTYMFDGWEDTNGNVYTAKLPPVTESMTYKAHFAANAVSYTIKFVNYDGTVLQNSEVAYGTIPFYEGATPEKDATDDYTYAFDGWDPEITAVTGEAIYTAKFKEVPRAFGEPVWTWAGNDENGYTSATATFTDANNPGVSKTVTDETIEIVTTAATCTTAGAIVYTATVTFNDQTYTDSKTVVIEAKGHDWEFVDFTWTETADGYTAVANYKCKNDATHTKTVEATVTSATTAATCEADGQTVYTATEGEHTDTKTVVIEAKGHDWGEPTYEWTEDYSTATATRVCKNDSEHVETETVNTTSEITKKPTLDARGETTYTAEFENAAFEKQTKIVDNIPKLPKADADSLTPTETVTIDGKEEKLEAEYKFTPVQPTDEQLTYYGNWYADYRVSMDADTAAESFGLYGAYSGYGQNFAEGFLFPQAMTANEPVKLLELANLSGVTYNDMVNNIGEFICGVFNESAQNVGKTFTVELIIWDPTEPETEYVIATTTYKFSSRTVTIQADNITKTYGDADPELTATVTGLFEDDTPNYTLTRVAGENVGEYAITVTLGENPNYDVTATNGTFTINKKAATVTADAKSKTYGDADPELTATVTGLVDSDTLNYTLTRAEGENVGEYAITVTLGENPNYDVTATNGTFTINKKAATVSADAKSKTYGETDPELTATVTGLVGEDTLNYSLSREVGENAGEYAITVTLGENPNYDVTATNGTFTITPITAEYEITVTGNSDTKVYNGSEQCVNGYTVSAYDPTITFTGIAQDDAKATAKGTNVGTYTMTMTDADFSAISDNYTNIKITVVPGTLEITPITDEIVVTIKGHKDAKTYTASEQEVTGYDVETSNALYTEADFSFTGEATAKGTEAGTYPMGLAESQLANTSTNFTNVRFVVTDGELKITNAALVITVTGHKDTKTYTGSEQEVTGYDLSCDSPLYDATLVSFIGEAVAKGTNVGTYLMGLDKSHFSYGNDSITVEFNVVDGELKINPAAITITADNKTKVYDNDASTDPELSATVTSVPANGVAPVYSLSREDGQDAGTYAITVTAEAASNPNYTITVEGGTFEITKHAITITINGSDDTKEYYGSAQTSKTEVTPSCSDSLFDASKFSYTGATTITETNVGNYSEAIDITKAAYADNNLDVSFVAGTDVTFEITAKAVTITVANASKIYGEADPAFTGTVVGLVNDGDLGTITYSRTGSDEDVGTYNDVLTASYTANANYTVTVVPGDFEITAKAVTITVVNASKTYGATDPALTATVEGVKEGDTLNYTLTRAEGENVGEYTITVTLGENPNYDVTATNGTFTINPKTVTATVVVEPTEYRYYGTAIVPTAVVVKDGETSIPSSEYTVSYSANNAVGTATVTITDVEGGNYLVTGSTTFTILPGSFTITFVSEDGTTLQSGAVNYGETPACSETPTKAYDETYHYSFSGWTPELAPVTADATYTATFTSVEHIWGEWTQTTAPTCTEAGAKTRTCTCGASQTQVIEALGHDYELTGWNWTGYTTATATFTCKNNTTHVETVNAMITSAEGTGDDLGYTVYTATVSFNGNTYTDKTRTLIEYSITYNGLDDATLEAANPTSYTVESDEITLNNPTKAHYTFTGWTGTDLSEATMNVTIPASSTGDRTYTATWTALTEYYLVGTIDGENLWNTIVDEYLFTPNPDAEEGVEEYILNITLHEGDSFKVRRVTGGVLGTYTNDWFPQAENYSVDAEHSGDVTVLFRPNGDGGDDWHYHVIYIPATAKMNTFTHSDNFANVDSYLYRVGNGNAVKLGALFKVDQAGDSPVDASNVKIKVIGRETNSSVYNATRGLEPGSSAHCTYTIQSDWMNSTLKFDANCEGPVQVIIKEGDNGAEYTLNLEVVNANNATTATSATSANIVLLNNVSGGLSVSNGKILYGNGFTVTDTRSNPSGTSGYVNITNGTVDNIKFVGYEPTTAVASGIDNPGYAPSVRAANGANLYNVYISGGRYALLIDGGTVTLKNSWLDGGAVGNMKMEGGTVIMEDCKTSSSTRGGLKGLGIHLTSANAKIVIRGSFEQHNWLTLNDMPSAYRNMLSSMFNSNSGYSYTNGGKTYVNMGILGIIDGQNFYASTMQNQIEDTTGNNYGYEEKSVTSSITGTIYTAKTSMGSASGIEDPVDSRMQNESLPSFTFDYINKNYIANTGDDTFCVYDSTTGKVMISLKQSNASDTFDWDPMILEAKKYNQILSYTVAMNNHDYTNQSISFAESGDYTVTYTVTDPYNFDKDTNKSSVVYNLEVRISVTIIEPDAVVYHPEFSYAGSWSGYQATSVTAGGSTYIMPNATGTSSTIASKQVNGVTIYMPIIEVKGKNSSGNSYSNGKIYCFAPAFSAINIVDKDVNTGATLYTYNSNTQKWPHNNAATSGPNRDYYGPSGARDPYGAGTGATYEKYAYNANNGGLCFTSNEIERDINEKTIQAKFYYIGNDGVTYNYYIQYRYNAVKYDSCIIAGTMITLANGAQKAVENLTASDRILSWDFFTGEYVAQDISILVDHGENEYRVTNMTFSDGTVLRTIADHGLFDVDQNKFVYIVPENYESFIGHRFVKQKLDGGYDVVELVDVIITTETTHAYSITAAYTSNAFAAGLLTVAPPEKFYNWIKMGDTLRYDTEWFNAQLDRYGTYDYSVFADYVTEKQFDQWNGKYLKIAVESGRITFEEILELIDMYKQYMPE